MTTVVVPHSFVVNGAPARKTESSCTKVVVILAVGLS